MICPDVACQCRTEPSASTTNQKLFILHVAAKTFLFLKFGLSGRKAIDVHGIGVSSFGINVNSFELVAVEYTDIDPFPFPVSRYKPSGENLME